MRFEMLRISLYQKTRRLVSGFSLVELMVTITLMAIVGIGVVSLMDYVNTTRVKVQQSVKLIDDIDQAELYVRTKLKTADRIVIEDGNISPFPDEFSSEWLLLLKRFTTDRIGVNFTNNSGAVTAEGYRGPGSGSSFTLGMWFKRDNTSMTDIETIARWGRYSLTDNSSLAILLSTNGGLGFKFGQKLVHASTLDGMADGKWHNLVVSFDNATSSGTVDSNSWKVYVDGYPRDLSFMFPGMPLRLDDEASGDEFEIGKAFEDDDNSSDFGGYISDLQLYSSPARVDQAAIIYNDGTSPVGMTQELHWTFSGYASETFPDNSGNDRDGSASGLTPSAPTLTTTDERYFGDVFALIDRPNDGNDNYELEYRANHNDCPRTAGEAAGFEAVSTDIFVKPEFAPFFSFANRDNASDDRDANDLLFTYGYRSGTGQASFSYDAQPKKLALNKKFFDEDFCRADPNLVLNAPPGVGTCNIDRGFAYIATDYDNLTDELFIPNAPFWSDNNTYYDIPNAPSTVRATWNSETGVMRYSLSDGVAISIEEWEQTMRSLSYRPKSEDYIPTKDLVISLGYLPMKINDEFHFYDFVEVADGVRVDWPDSQTAANNTMFCGTAGYLATVTSAEENSFLIERFRKETGAVPAGWLGGHDSNDIGTWVWESNSPEAGLGIWHQTDLVPSQPLNGGGEPFKTDNTTASATEFTIQEVASSSDFLRPRVTIAQNGAELVFHNFAAQEPNNAGGNNTTNAEPYLQIVGSSGGNGLWNDLPDSNTCDDDEFYRPCGYYIEFGGRPGQSLNSLVFERTIDLSAQREFCSQD